MAKSGKLIGGILNRVLMVAAWVVGFILVVIAWGNIGVLEILGVVLVAVIVVIVLLKAQSSRSEMQGRPTG